jgi:hypothetical protein
MCVPMMFFAYIVMDLPTLVCAHAPLTKASRASLARARALSQPYGDGYWGVLFQGAKKEVCLTAHFDQWTGGSVCDPNYTVAGVLLRRAWFAPLLLASRCN